MLETLSEASGDGPPAAGPGRIILDGRCTDGTVCIAYAASPGALNQAAANLLPPELRADDSVLVLDAGSRLAPGFVFEARRRLQDGAGGVGGVVLTGTAT